MSHNKSIGCGASGAYAPGPDDEPRAERRPRVVESRVLREIFGPEKKELRGEWRKLHTQELHNLFCSLSRTGLIR